jgi:spore coat protein CotH
MTFSNMTFFKGLLFFVMLGSLQVVNSQTKPAAADFFAADKVQDIKITFKQKNWSYHLDSLRFNGDGLLAGIVEINGQRFENAGVRFRGFKSFAPGTPRNPLHIVLDSKDKTQTYQGNHVVKLSNTLRDPSMLREVLGYEIARGYMPAPMANFAKVTINGAYYGLLANIESVSDAQFLGKYFGSADNAMFKANQDAGGWLQEQPLWLAGIRPAGELLRV